mmetsp:Transcript_9556/g.27356  ORF Transcript_9556/g.27356 Transcript_9556/m.27356 type:complete len:1201 (+) Transcript_9556:257-3859(+)
MGRHCRLRLAFAFALLALAQLASAGLELFSAGKPVFSSDTPVALLTSDLMKANLAAELGKLAGDFRDRYGDQGIQKSGYSDANLRQVADDVSTAPDVDVASEEVADAGECRRTEDGEENLGAGPELEDEEDISLSGRLAESMDIEKQLDFLSDCTRASKIEVVFLGDEVVQRWDATSFKSLCVGMSVCANFGIQGQSVKSMLAHAQQLLATTCLSPKAWVVLAGTHQLIDSAGEEAAAIAKGITSTAEWIRGSSCHSDVLVVGTLPLDSDTLIPPEDAQAALVQKAANTTREGLAAWSRELSGPRMSFLSCLDTLKANNSTSLISTDGMTPTARGYSQLSACLAPAMARFAKLPKAVYKTNAPSAQVSVQSAAPESHCVWVYSDWTCDVSCGEGYATRTATCIDELTKLQMDQTCCEPLARESINSYCNRGECPQVAWITGRWGSCDKKCGGGVVIRTVECINSVNEAMADDLCYSGAQSPRPSSWKRCNTSPCPLRESPQAEQEAYYKDLTGPGIKEQLGLRGILQHAKDTSTGDGQKGKSDKDEQQKMLLLLGDLLPAAAGAGEETPPVNINGGVSIMSKSDSDDKDDDHKSGSDDSEDQTSVYEVDHTKHKGEKLSEEGASSDQGNGEPYRRKTLKELLTCYRDSDCGTGYECEPFTCVKACSVYTQRQVVSAELRNRFKPTPPTFVYQGMYQAIIFRGVGGVCYRKCHHMTRCNKRASDGTCQNFFCTKIEGCHDFPGDYHVPSLEECGVNGLCKPGKCRRTRGLSRVEGGSDLTAQSAMVDVTDPNACPGTNIPSATGCCPSGAVSSSNGTCCALGSVVDKDGECCPASQLDACGVCGGPSKYVDILGQCCASDLDANGVCCSGGREADECGVCGGWNASCTLTASYSIHSTSMAELEQTVHSRFPQDVVDAASSLGFTIEDVSVFNLTVDSMGEYEGPVSAAVTYQIVPSTTSRSLTMEQYRSLTDGLENDLASLERRGVCGNGLCEVGEQTRDGWEGTCPADCSWSGFVSCNCSGHGVCTAATGSCDCHKGYSGAMCAFCDEGYISIGDDANEGRALCVPAQLVGSLSSAVLRDYGGSSAWIPVPDALSLEEVEDAERGPHARRSSRDTAIVALLIATAVVAVVMLFASLVAYIVWRCRSPSSLPTPSKDAGDGSSKPQVLWSPPWSTADDVHSKPPDAAAARSQGRSPPSLK